MKTSLWTAALILFAVLPGCFEKGLNTNLNIEPKPVPGVDWSKYKTWSFASQGEYPLTHNEILDDPHFRQAVSDHTISAMNHLGYTHVNQDPDMLIMFHVIIEENDDEVKANPAYADYDMQWATYSEDDVWKQGSLMIFAIDAGAGSQIWGSTATAELDKESSFGTKKERFREVVSKMLADFPKRLQ